MTYVLSIDFRRTLMKYLKQPIRVKYIFYRFVKIVYALHDLNYNKNKGDLQIDVFLFENLTFLNTWINSVNKKIISLKKIIKPEEKFFF